MTKSIDERIVSMQFDNRRFQTGVSDTLSSIDKLKSGLNFTGASKGLESISASANKVSFGGLSSGIDAIQVKFSALQVAGIAALTNIVNSAVNAGKSIASSLTIDPIKDGFREYETQMGAIQTILANTSSKGTTLVDVTKALDNLNTYSDKTIYNFTEMTKNIGTFTAAGIDLDKSTTAIKGIANLAAVSGSNSEQASTAMYQLSQALAAGKVGLQDWNSVVNAGMGGEVFQNSLKDTARVHGVAVDKIIKDEGSFRESLSKGWITSAILTETLSKFTGDLTADQLKSMGYNEEQVAGILKMATTASDAATKVKTLSQLMDTLKEAVGSGWAKTWNTIFGDFDEAKVLFTGVSNTLGGLIGATSDARNKMLTGWKDLGGRTALIDSIKNAFDGLMGVVKAVSGAFRDIFPATTAAQLFNITNGLKTFTEKIKLSESSLSNLRSTFKGIFAILDIGKMIISAMFKAVGILSGGTGDLVANILKATGSLGEWLTAVRNSIKQSDVFSKVITTLAYGIKNVLNAIMFVVSKGGDAISYLATMLYPILSLIGKRFNDTGDNAKNMAKNVGGAFKLMGQNISNSQIGELLTKIYNMFTAIGKGIGKIMGDLANTINNSIKKVNFSTILDGITALSIGGMLLAFKKFMSSLKDVLGESKGFFSNVTGILDDVRGSFEAYQQNLKAGVLIKLGIAIALLAGSIVAISLIDSGKLVSSLAAIGTLFAQLLVAMKLYSYIGSFKTQVVKSSIVMIAMSTSILILAGAMTKLAKLDWNGVAKGLVGVGGLAGTLVATAKVLSKGTPAMVKGAAGMVVFAVAIKVLASACIDLSTLNWKQLVKGLGGVGILMGEISLFLKTAKMDSKLILTATGIVILATAMKILASAVSDFGNIPWKEIVKGLGSVGILLAEIALFTKVSGNSKQVITTSISLGILAGAMKLLASALSDFGNLSFKVIVKGLIAMSGALVGIAIGMKMMPNDMLVTSAAIVILAGALKILASVMVILGGMTKKEIVKGLIAMGGALVEIAIAMRMMPNDMIATSIGLVIVAGAISMLSDSLVKMGNMSIKEIVKSLIALGGAMVILAVGLHAMNSTLPGSAALLVASAAIALLVPSLERLGNMPIKEIVKSLIALAAAIGIFGLAALILTPLIVPMLGLAAALVLLGVAVLAVGAGLALAGLGLTSLAAGFTLLAGVTTIGATAIVQSLSIIIVGIIALIPQILEKIGEGIVAFLKVLSDSIPAILESVTTIFLAILQCIVTNAPAVINSVLQILSDLLAAVVKWAPVVIDSVLQILSDLLAAVVKWAPVLVQQVFDILLAILDTIANNLGKFIDAGVDIIVSFVQGVANSLIKVINAAAELIVTFINGLADAIRKNSGPIGDACLNLVTAIVDSIGSFQDKMLEAGSYAVQGFIQGLVSIPGKVWAAGKALGKSALDAAKNALDSHSPSREFTKVGVFSAIGLVNGLVSCAKKVGAAGYDMGLNAVNSVSKAISGISDVMNGDINSTPVIRPVMDLTNIQNGTSELNGLFNSLDNKKINGAINMTNSKAQRINDKSNNPLLDNKVDNISATNNSNTPKQPITLQMVLSNGRAIAEYVIDDLDSLTGSKNRITGRMVGMS